MVERMGMGMGGSRFGIGRDRKEGQRARKMKGNSQWRGQDLHRKANRVN